MIQFTWKDWSFAQQFPPFTNICMYATDQKLGTLSNSYVKEKFWYFFSNYVVWSSRSSQGTEILICKWNNKWNYYTPFTILEAVILILFFLSYLVKYWRQGHKSNIFLRRWHKECSNWTDFRNNQEFLRKSQKRILIYCLEKRDQSIVILLLVIVS